MQTIREKVIIMCKHVPSRSMDFSCSPASWAMISGISGIYVFICGTQYLKWAGFES